MVKVPRSTGCRTCVQRRIKCDQTRPFCQRCVRANRQCTGFEVKWVDEGPSIRGIYDDSGKRLSSGKSSSSAASPESPASASSQLPPGAPIRNRTANTTRQNSRNKSLTPIHGDNWFQGSFERASLVSILTPNTYQDQLLGNFIASVRQPSLAPTFRSHGSWLTELATRPTLSTLLTWAIRAISISHLARKASDDTLMETSRRIYGNALLRLSKSLQDSEEGLSSDTLSATVLLSFYEVFNCTDRDSWIRHAGGAGRLIQMRGPNRHRSGFDRLVFLSCRTTLIFEAFSKKVPCFLAEPPWRKLCWDIHDELPLSAPLRTSDEEYFQELVSYPAYLGKTRDLIGDPDAKSEAVQDLLNAGIAHRSLFISTHTRMGEEMAEAGNEPTQVPSSSNDTLFPIVYHYPDIHVATHYCCYWAVMCAINISIIGLEAKLAGLYDLQAPPERGEPALWNADSPGDINPATNIKRTAIWDAARQLGNTHAYISENGHNAREICKSAEYMSRTPFLGPWFLVISLRMALRMFIKPEEKAWIVRKLVEIGRSMGVAALEIERYQDQREGRYGIEWEQEGTPTPP